MRKMEYSVCHERGTKKKCEFPTGIEPKTSLLLERQVLQIYVFEEGHVRVTNSTTNRYIERFYEPFA